MQPPVLMHITSQYNDEQILVRFLQALPKESAWRMVFGDILTTEIAVLKNSSYFKQRFGCVTSFMYFVNFCFIEQFVN